jgi:hypothetical protein
MRFLSVIAFSTRFHRAGFRIHHRPAVRCRCFAIACESDASLDQYLLSPAAATKKIRQTKNHLIGFLPPFHQLWDISKAKGMPPETLLFREESAVDSVPISGALS